MLFVRGLCQLFTVRLSNGTPRDLLSKVLCRQDHDFEGSLWFFSWIFRDPSFAIVDDRTDWQTFRTHINDRAKKESIFRGEGNNAFSGRNRARIFVKGVPHLAMPQIEKKERSAVLRDRKYANLEKSVGKTYGRWSVTEDKSLSNYRDVPSIFLDAF